MKGKIKREGGRTWGIEGRKKMEVRRDSWVLRKEDRQGWMDKRTKEGGFCWEGFLVLQVLHFSCFWKNQLLNSNSIMERETLITSNFSSPSSTDESLLCHFRNLTWRILTQGWKPFFWRKFFSWYVLDRLVSYYSFTLDKNSLLNF